MRAAALAVFAVLVLAGCGGGAPHSTAATPTPAPPSAADPAPSSSAPGAAFCARLKASPKNVQVIYANEVERQVGLASGGGTVGPEAIQAARTMVALWITISCPKFAWLEQNG